MDVTLIWLNNWGSLIHYLNSSLPVRELDCRVRDMVGENGK